MGNEPAVETLSATTRARWRGDKRPTNVQLGISAKLYRKMRALATSQGLPFATWLRQTAIAELRRARKRG
jgi:hypothetical protein